MVIHGKWFIVLRKQQATVESKALQRWTRKDKSVLDLRNWFWSYPCSVVTLQPIKSRRKQKGRLKGQKLCKAYIKLFLKKNYFLILTLKESHISSKKTWKTRIWEQYFMCIKTWNYCPAANSYLQFMPMCYWLQVINLYLIFLLLQTWTKKQPNKNPRIIRFRIFSHREI